MDMSSYQQGGYWVVTRLSCIMDLCSHHRWPRSDNLLSKVTRGEVEEWPGKLCINAATTTD